MITESMLNRLNRFQVRILLDCMGLPFKDQPKKVGELQRLLLMASKGEPEKFEQAYKAIVKYDWESAGSEMREELKKYSDMAHLVEDKLEDYESKGFENLKIQVARDVNKTLEKVFEEACEQIEYAKKQVITVEHVVKVGKKSKTLTDVILPECFDQLLQLAQQRKNILMVGPAGCGKTHTASLIAKALDLDYGSQSCSAGMSESALIGWLLPTGESGEFTYVASEFIKMYENGGVFLLDELDASDPNVIVFINQALAQECFYLPQRFENPKVVKHKDFVAIGAANTYGTGANSLYTARNALDAATLDRFKIGTVEMDYSDKLEEKLIDSEVLEWGKLVRKMIVEKSLIKIMSTRVLLDATDMKTNQEWSMDRIEESYFSDWSKQEVEVWKNFKRENQPRVTMDPEAHAETSEWRS